MTPQEQRAAYVARQQAITDAARNDGNRSLTADETAEFNRLQGQIDQIDTALAAGDASRSASSEPAGSQPAPTAPSQPATDEARAIQAERSRIMEINSICRDFNLDPSQYISSGATVEAVRAAVIENLRGTRGPIATGVQITGSGEDDFRRDASDALLIRGGLTPQNATSGATQLSHLSLRDLAVECLERSGNTNARRMSADDILADLSRQFYSPVAAFPAILDQTIEKAYIQGHRTAPVTFDRWTRRGTLSDFKRHDNYYIQGPIGEFQEVPEGAELKHDIPTDAKRPTRQLKTFGKQFTLTRQAFINDDIGLVTSIPARFAAAARKTINTQVYKVLLGDTTIYDGEKLFSEKHRNLLTQGTLPTMESVQAMIMVLSTQTDEFGQPIIMRPKELIVPAGFAFLIYTLFNSPYIQTESNTQAVNPLYNYRNTLDVIEDPTINALSGGWGQTMPWFITADGADSDFIEVDYLNGQDVPQIRRMEAPGQLGFIWDIWLDWGITVMDFRGAVKNPGAAVKDPLSKE